MSPSPFIVEWVERFARERDRPARALDVAMGSGRHAVMMARAGLLTFGVDIKVSAVRETMQDARREGVRVHGWCADLTQHPLPQGRFDLVVVARYLQRDLFPALRAALAPGGVLLYETFTLDQRALQRPPTSPDHLLEPDELRLRFADLDLLFYEEVRAPDAVARLAARSRS